MAVLPWTLPGRLLLLFSSVPLAVLLPSCSTGPRALGPAVVRVQGCGASNARATGFLISPRLVMTVAHVTRARSDNTDNRWFFVDHGRGHVLAELLVSDPSRDIALLRLPASTPFKATRVAWRTSTVGARVFSLAFDAHDKEVRRSLVVRKLVRALGPQVDDVTPVRRAALALTGAILPGDSGAPLVDAAGSVVGMVFSESRDHVGGYAIDTEELKSFAGMAARQRAEPPTDQPPACGERKAAAQ
jgi:S1-C subfamily serine protease